MVYIICKLLQVERKFVASHTFSFFFLLTFRSCNVVPMSEEEFSLYRQFQITCKFWKSYNIRFSYIPVHY